MPSMRMLLVDDDPDSLTLLARHLEPHAASLLTSTSGQEGLERFAAALADHAPFHVVFLDLHMPGLDGVQLLTAMRRLEANAHTPCEWCARVIMVTGESSRMHVERAVQGGCNGYLLKPFTGEELHARMSAAGLALSESAGALQ
jgi:two-component system, chemotaxis family, chemotaxis protein CheY